MSLRCIAVDYLNTLPLRAGLARLERAGALSLALAHPSAATRRFGAGRYDIGLLPVAAGLEYPEATFVGDHGIVCDGFVGSVGIFSEVPLREVDTLYLDHDSRSSVLLAELLLEHHWDLAPSLVPAPRGYRDRIGGRSAGVIIGDPAIAARARFRYYYDLGEAWREMTGLSFVFAAWLAHEQPGTAFVSRFDEAQRAGLDQRLDLARELQGEVPNYNLERYFTRQIRYTIDDRARRGRELFLELGAQRRGLGVPELVA